MLLQFSTPPRMSNVTGHVRLIAIAGQQAAHKAADPPSAVVWLEPLRQGPSDAFSLATEKTYSMVQKNKQFYPRFLVVQIGSMVSFPNKDPFFHNVFSLFNGKRFDLGLYEEGSTRGVKFNRTGVSYIFCNIHPQMNAVIVTLDTPYYAIPDAAGNLLIRGVPSGAYRLKIWAEGASSETLAALTRIVHVSPVNQSLGDWTIRISQAFPANHKNKFGQAYDKNQPLAY
ncbi:MAG: cupredoxin domain-containing protein [Acidobacteriaceae bacterium]